MAELSEPTRWAEDWCGCPSVLRHGPACPKTHPEFAALPKAMPQTISLGLAPCTDGSMPACVQVDYVNPAEERELVAYVSPDEARGLARALLIKAEEAERYAG